MMNLRNTPIQRKLMSVILLTCSVVLVLMCGAYIIFEFFSFRNSVKNNVSTLGLVIAANSSGALAFDSPDDADEVLNALRADPHITTACLYDKNGRLFAKYPSGVADSLLPAKPQENGYRFKASYLEGFQSVQQQTGKLGTLFIRSDLEAMYAQLEQFIFIAFFLIVGSLVVAYLLSNLLQRSISKPILALQQTARIISERQNYGIRAVKMGDDELGALTDAFNQMLSQIEAQNIAIKKAAEESAKLAAIVESSDDAIISKTLNGIVTSWNNGAHRLFGYTADEMVGQSVLKIIPPDRHSEEPEIISRLKNGEHLEHFETLRLTKDNKLLDVSLTISPLMSDDGYITGMSKIARDITAKKREEQRKNDFIAMVSHELKTPLTSVKGYVQVLLAHAKADGNPFTVNALNRADMQVRKMTSMIQDFLSLARLEEGKIQINKERFELHAVMLDIVNDAQFLSSSHKVVLKDCEEIALYADRDKIGQVLINLLSNAIKYSPKGGNITMGCEKAGGKVKVYVRDEGVGINPIDQKRLFDRFYRVTNEKIKTVSGFGIGLYLVAEILRYHNSKITVESIEDSGSTFSFVLDMA